jgi:hypothetical protein
MHRAEFRAHNNSLKVNGNHFGIKWIKSEQHKKIMLEYIEQLKTTDKLAERQHLRKTENSKVSFLLTY